MHCIEPKIYTYVYVYVARSDRLHLMYNVCANGEKARSSLTLTSIACTLCTYCCCCCLQSENQLAKWQNIVERLSANHKNNIRRKIHVDTEKSESGEDSRESNIIAHIYTLHTYAVCVRVMWK